MAKSPFFEKLRHVQAPTPEQLAEINDALAIVAGPADELETWLRSEITARAAVSGISLRYGRSEPVDLGFRYHVIYNARLTSTAGRAHQMHGVKILELNRKLCSTLSRDELRTIAIHEWAHLACGPGHGHGRVWQAVMIGMGEKPSRCHSYDVPVRKASRVAAFCNCGKVDSVTKLVGNRISKGSHLYACTTCRSAIKLP